MTPKRPLHIKLFSRLSIRQKILVVAMTASFFAMMVTSLTFITYQYFAFQDWLWQNLTSQSEIIAYNSKGALAFDDPDEGEAVLRSLLAVESMTGAALFAADGSLFAQWQRDGSSALPVSAPTWQGRHEFEKEFFITQYITKRERILGTILLRSDHRERTAYLRSSLGTLAGLILLSGAFTLILSIWLQKIISEPMDHLAEVMKKVSNKQDYSIRGIRYTDDEIGELTDFLNQMLTQIESRDLKLRENEDLLQSIINNTNSVIYLKDLEGRYLMVNRSFKEMITTRYKDIIGRTDAELFQTDQCEKFKTKDQKVLDAGKLIEIEEEAPHTDGMHTYISAKFPLRDHDGKIYALCGISTDITERKKSEKELGHLRNYLASVVDSMPSALIGLDPQGLITQWNKEAERLSGRSFSQVKGFLLSDIIPQLFEQVALVKEAIRDRQVKECTVKYIQDNGIRFMELTIYPLISKEVEGAVLRVDDITERIQIEEMMVQTEKMMSIGGLAAGMAHEINNPLGIMVQAVQNIERRVSVEFSLNEKVADKLGVSLTTIHDYLENREILTMLDDIREAGTRAAKIVSNMLQFSRRSESVRQYVKIDHLIDQSMELANNDYDLKKKFDFRQINVVRNSAQNTPEIKLVATEIEQVLLNLLKNAAQAFPNKEFKNEEPTITITTDLEDGFVKITISDNGPGMPEEIRKRIFEPFFTTKPVGMGTGLGLSVSYMIITNNHKGRLEVQSIPEQGTTFSIYLPLNETHLLNKETRSNL